MTAVQKSVRLRRSPKADARKAAIKLAAIEAFSVRGYEQTTMDDLAAAAGVSKALLYWHWKSKGALLTELIDECLLKYQDLLTKAVESEARFQQKLPRLLTEAADLLEENRALNQVVHFCSLHTSGKTEERFSAQTARHFQKIVKLLRALLRQGVESGYFGADQDPADLAHAALCLIEGHIYLSIVGVRRPLTNVVAPLRRLLLPDHR